MKDKKKIIYFAVSAIVITAVLALVVVRILQSKLFSGNGTEAATKNPVTVVDARIGKIRSTLFYTGDIHAEKEALVYTIVAGRVTKYNFKEGDKVSKGDILVFLEHEETWDEFKPIIVQSPISGTVAVNYLDIGERANTTTPLCLVIGGKPVKVYIRIPDTELSSVKEGMKVEVTVPNVPDKIYEGVVERVSPVIERTTRTSQVEISINNHDSELRAGMFGDTRIILSEKADAIVIPFDALLFEKEGMQGPYCFVVDKGIAKKRPLVLGIMEDEKVEVASGIAVGEKVVTLGKENLSDGSTVQIIESQ